MKNIRKHNLVLSIVLVVVLLLGNISNSTALSKNGWIYDKGHWYYLNSDGTMHTGWLNLDNYWYYLNNSGEMQIGWKVINNIKYLFDADGKMVDGARYFVIDISKWQGNINWSQLKKENIDGIILRTSYGLSTDSKLKSYLREIKKLKIPYGFYHFNTAKNTVDAKKQAEYAIKVIKENDANPKLPVFVDIETNSSSDLVSIAKTYCSEFIKNGFLPGIYANTNYWQNYLKDTSLNAYYKWIANYGTKNNNNNATASPTFKTKDSIKNYMMWQYTSQGTLNGVKDNTVDFNAMYEWYIKPNGWKLINNIYYYYKNNGHLSYDWDYIDGLWYYFNLNGEMQTGWIYDKSKWYYCSSNGNMLKYWQYIDNQWYYFNSSGEMRTGWIYDRRKWYYCNNNGNMLKHWQYIDNQWYYFNSNGEMKTGWIYDKGKWYYCGQNGNMLKYWQYIDNQWYYFNSNGEMQTGWIYDKGKWYYCSKNGSMMKYWQYIDNQWYYFNSNGEMFTGWHYIDNKWYYFYSNGAMK